MKTFGAALGLGVAVLSGGACAFVPPAGGSYPTTTSTSASLRDAVLITGEHAWGSRPRWSRLVKTENMAATRRPRTPMPSAKADPGLEEERQARSSASSMSGVGSVGSNVLLLVALAMVVKGMLLPEDIRHLGFCPLEDPIRGRDTLPWRMMTESGRECGTIPEVMTKYLTAPLVLPGSPEWGMMLNVKEELAKDAWLQ